MVLTPQVPAIGALSAAFFACGGAAWSQWMWVLYASSHAWERCDLGHCTRVTFSGAKRLRCGGCRTPVERRADAFVSEEAFYYSYYADLVALWPREQHAQVLRSDATSTFTDRCFS